jgi:hypothetical protein
VSEVLFCLCCNCGTITLERSWTYWQRDEETWEWRPSRDGEGDPMCKCPECEWEHIDDDSNPGLYLGSLQEMHAERETIRDDYTEFWAITLEEIAERAAVPLKETTNDGN